MPYVSSDHERAAPARWCSDIQSQGWEDGDEASRRCIPRRGATAPARPVRSIRSRRAGEKDPHGLLLTGVGPRSPTPALSSERAVSLDCSEAAEVDSEIYSAPHSSVAVRYRERGEPARAQGHRGISPLACHGGAAGGMAVGRRRELAATSPAASQQSEGAAGPRAPASPRTTCHQASATGAADEPVLADQRSGPASAWRVTGVTG